MKLSVAALCALAGIQAACIAQAEIRPEQTHTALAAIDDAKALVAAGRGQLLLVGSALTTEQTPSENVLVVLEYPLIRDMKPGMILILARNGCKPIESCLIARRVSYAIDLETDSIRDMRAGTARSITLAQAIADEEAQAQPGTARF
jgi:hypothetical protein